MLIAISVLALAAQSGFVKIEGAASRPAGIYACLERDQSFYGEVDRGFQECVEDAKPMVDAVKARFPSLAQNPSDQGCLGKDIITCMATLASRLRVTSSEAGGIMGEMKLKPVSVDIYGKRQSVLESFHVIPLSPAPPESIQTELWAPDGEHVEKITFVLNHSPISASTQDDWVKTGTYELASAALGACAGSDRLAFYRAYDTAQTNGGTTKSFNDSYSDPGISSGLHGKLKLCDAEISTITASGVSVELGSWAGSSMTIERAEMTPSIPPKTRGTNSRPGHRRKG